MLILTRRLGENIVIGDDIVISVMEVRGDAVRLGIQAPRSVTVHREEVYRELQRANQAAAQSGASDDAVAAVARGLRPPADRSGSRASDQAGSGRAGGEPAGPGAPPPGAEPRSAAAEDGDGADQDGPAHGNET